MANNECVKVAVRTRPLNSKEINENDKSIIEIDHECNQLYVQCKDFTGKEAPKTYAFDYVFGPKTNQMNVFTQCASPLIDSVLKGYNGTLFCYGQTGTGKTYTMEGNIKDETHSGIIPRTFKQIMDYVNNSEENIEFLVRISFLEIYQDEVYDLLTKGNRQKMMVKEGKNGFYVKNLTMYSVKCTNDMYKVLKKGSKSRAVGATAMNPGSSRSHSILTIVVEQSTKGNDGQDHYILGKLNLVDLAGSERQKKTLSVGDRLNEAKFINLSLSALGNVIKALVNSKATHIPFRDSKLTRLLSDSLGGNTKTLMIANVGPSHNYLDETMSTLRYANRAKNIKNKPRINMDPKDAMIKKMKDELNNLKKQLLNGPNAHTTNGSQQKIEIQKKKVEIWKGVSTKEVEQLKLKAIDAKKKLKDLHKKDEAKYEMARIEAEKAAKSAEQNLKIAQDRLESEHSELKVLENKLKIKTFELIHGGKKLNEARAKEKELLETDRKLRETEKSQKHFLKELDAMIENEQMFDGKFGAMKEEISDTTLKLKTLWKKYQQKTSELRDLEEENIFEEKELSENIKELSRQFQLKEKILEYFIPSKWLQFIEDHSQFDSEIDQWRIPALEYSGNNVMSGAVQEFAVGRRPLTELKMTQIWKRVQMVNDDNGSLSSSMNTEIQEAIDCAINTNIDPNQCGMYGEKVYLTYGVDTAKSKRHK